MPTRRAAPIGGYMCHVPVLPGAIGWIVGAESPPSDLPGMERVAVGVTTPTGPSVARRVPARGARELAVGLEVRERAARDRTSQRISAGQRWVPRVGGTGCKTVGFAYVGSNPTPATTCENGPLAVDSPPAGRFFFVPSCVTL